MALSGKVTRNDDGTVSITLPSEDAMWLINAGERLARTGVGSLGQSFRVKASERERCMADLRRQWVAGA